MSVRGINPMNTGAYIYLSRCVDRLTNRVKKRLR